MIICLVKPVFRWFLIFWNKRLLIRKTLYVSFYPIHSLLLHKIRLIRFKIKIIKYFSIELLSNINMIKYQWYFKEMGYSWESGWKKLTKRNMFSWFIISFAIFFFLIVFLTLLNKIQIPIVLVSVSKFYLFQSFYC